MRQVSQDEFFKPIYDKGLDVHPSILPGRFPYTSEFRFHRQHNTPIYGKIVDRVEGGRTISDYFIAQ